MSHPRPHRSAAVPETSPNAQWAALAPDRPMLAGHHSSLSHPALRSSPNSVIAADLRSAVRPWFLDERRCRRSPGSPHPHGGLRGVAGHPARERRLAWR